MFKNYLKVAIRNTVKFQYFSLINITGLAIGMTVCLLMLMFVVNELSYENFHENREQIYRVWLKWGTEESKMKFAGSMPAIAPAFEVQIPEVIKATRIRKDYDAVITNRENPPVKEENLFFADPAVFEIFSFTLKEGDKSSILAEPFTAIISESVARKYFDNASTLGQTLHYQDNLLKITGIVEDIPANTHLNCGILVSYSTLEALGQLPPKPWNNWGDDFTYVLLQDDTDLAATVKKMDELLLQNTSEWFASRMKFILQPLTQIHWDSEARGDIGPKGNINYVYLFLSAALLILVIACFNFMNLSTSRYFNRMKEVGIRKVIGAKQNQLIKQFLTESFLIILISVGISIATFELVHPVLYTYLDTEIVFETVHFQYLYSIVLIIIIVVGFFAGGYPAFYLSRFRPVEIIRPTLQVGSNKLSFRKVLIVMQFAISIILILGSIIIFQQLDFMKNSDLGFQKEDVLLIRTPYASEDVKQKYPVLRDELLKHASIVSVSSAYTVPGINSRMNMSVTKEGSPSENSVNLQALPADFGFVSSMDLTVLEGRDFSKEFALDNSESLLLNQSAVKALGIKQPVGTKLKIPGDKKFREVIGIVADFHVQSLHHKINPMLIYINPKMVVTLAIKILPDHTPDVLQFVKTTWNNVLPDHEFNYRFMEDAYDQLYVAEEKTGKLLTAFTMLAVFVSCLGLLGLASLIGSQKTKEIGVRKVLGATTTSIIILFSKEFTIWVVAANIIAWPLAWLAVDKWLQSFAYGIDISIWIFLLAGGFALIIALLTVSSLAFKAALANPVEALKYE